MKYRQYKLSDISTNMFYGTMPRTDDFVDNGYPVFSGYRIVGQSRKYNLHNRTLVVVARGVGGTGDVKIAPEKSFLTNLSIAVELDEEMADLDFMYYYLNSQGLRYLDTGAAQSQITINNLKSHKVFIPPIKTQKRLASIVMKYDDLIENNNKRIKLLEQTAEEIYKEWFVRFRFPGYEDAEFENGIPKGWNVTRCKDIVPIVTGKKDANYGDDGGNYPFFTCAQDAIKAPGYSFDCNAVLLAGNCDLNVKIYQGKFEAYQRVYVLSPYEDKYLYLLYYVIEDNVEVLKKASTGAAISFITKGMIERIYIVIPPEKLLNRFNQIIKSIFDEKEILIKKNENLISQRDYLLPRLLSGKLEV